MTLQNASYLCQPHFITKLHESACVYFYTLSDFVLFICDFLVIMLVMAFQNHIFNLNILKKNIFVLSHNGKNIYMLLQKIPRALPITIIVAAGNAFTNAVTVTAFLTAQTATTSCTAVSRISCLRRRHGFCLILQLLLNSIWCKALWS